MDKTGLVYSLFKQNHLTVLSAIKQNGFRQRQDDNEKTTEETRHRSYQNSSRQQPHPPEQLRIRDLPKRLGAGKHICEEMTLAFRNGG